MRGRFLFFGGEGKEGVMFVFIIRSLVPTEAAISAEAPDALDGVGKSLATSYTARSPYFLEKDWIQRFYLCCPRRRYFFLLTIRVSPTLIETSGSSRQRAL